MKARGRLHLERRVWGELRGWRINDSLQETTRDFGVIRIHYNMYIVLKSGLHWDTKRSSFRRLLRTTGTVVAIL